MYFLDFKFVDLGRYESKGYTSVVHGYSEVTLHGERGDAALYPSVYCVIDLVFIVILITFRSIYPSAFKKTGSVWDSVWTPEIWLGTPEEDRRTYRPKRCKYFDCGWNGGVRMWLIPFCWQKVENFTELNAVPLLCCIVTTMTMTNYTNTYTCMQNTMTQWRRATHDQMKTSDTVLRKIYLSLYLKGCVWEGVGDWTELQHIDPHSIGHNRFSFPFSWAAQPEVRGPTLMAFSTASLHQRV